MAREYSMNPGRAAGCALLAFAMGLGAGCAQQPAGAGAAAQVRGTATYKERLALPPDAVLEVTLEDVSKAGARSEVIGSARVERPGNPPFAFAIPYDPAKIEAKNRYSVRARILAGDRLIFTTDRHYPVLTGGHGDSVELWLRMTGGAGQAGDEPLENTYWKLTHLGDTPVAPAAERQREAHFILHPDGKRVSGSGGCNRLAGAYERKGDRLSFGKMAATLMACPAGMDTERAFHEALARAQRAKVTRTRLELLDAAGAVVARFEAVHLR